MKSKLVNKSHIARIIELYGLNNMIEDVPDSSNLLDCLFTVAGQHVVLEVYQIWYDVNDAAVATHYVFCVHVISSDGDYITVGEDFGTRVKMVSRTIYPTLEAAMKQHDLTRDAIVKQSYA